MQCSWYDEINQKGFEGDTVLYGFAGFIRNLLVCKDQSQRSPIRIY